MSNAFKLLEDGVKNLITSEQWLEYLKFQKSSTNIVSAIRSFILIQRPSATMVMGYKKWQELGRYVKKGEHGIAILAPVVKKVKNNDDDEDEETVVKLCGFRTVYVFDVEQTEGKPLPKVLRRIEGSNYEWLLNRLIDVGKKIEFEILFEDTGVVDGYCDVYKKVIAIQPQHGINHQVSVLAHELGHALLHENSDMLLEDKEFEAESVAFCVLNYFGLDNSSHSFPYIAMWKKGNIEECKNFILSGERINRTAKKIIELSGGNVNEETN